MHTIRRSCHTALQSRNAIIFPTVSRRAFSQSPVIHRGALPVYLPASNPELASLLSTLNSKVLLPSHLSKEQRKLVYSQALRAKLEAEPIEVTLGEVTLPLEHIDRNRDLPSKVKTWSSIIERSQTREDWENVVRMMEGFENAGRVKTQWWEKVVRKLNENGMHHLILKAVQRASATGLRLRDWGLVVEVMRAVRDKAASASWEKEELVKALKMAEQIVELLEEDEHLGKVEGETDWRTHPAVIAVPLEMAAELAYRHEGDEAKVKKYAVRLMNALKQRGYIDSSSSDLTHLKTLIAQTPSDFPNTTGQAKAVTNLARAMYSQIPIWNSLSTTRTVLDDSMPMPQEAEQVQKAIWALLEQGLETLGTLSVRGESPIVHETKGYPAYVRNAIEACLDDGEDVE